MYHDNYVFIIKYRRHVESTTKLPLPVQYLYDFSRIPLIVATEVSGTNRI